MQYSEIDQSSNCPYPSHNIDPKEKNEQWGMQYARAAFYDWTYGITKGVFAANGGNYQQYRLYALGKQPIDQYKKILGVDAKTNNTWLSVDWSVRPIVSTYRDRALSRLMKADYETIATPIDMLAKAELDVYYSDLKAKLVLRQLMQQQNPDLANHPMIQLQNGEPMDLEELEMRIDLGEQFNRSQDAEKCIALGFYENGYKLFRKGIYEDLFDYGVAGYKEWLGEDNKAKFRKVNPQNVITSVAQFADFRDMVHAGELIDVSLIDLATKTDKEGNRLFTEEQLTEFAGQIKSQFGNPQQVGVGNNGIKPYDKFKCKVLDLEFFSYNTEVYRTAPDSNGNADFRKADYNRGRKSDKYTRKCFKVVYKVKWIVGTEKCYDFELATDMKRANDPKKKAETSLSYKFIAYNFHDMKAQGFMERLIPDLDDYQLTILKIQNFKNRAVPSGFWIDLDGLERAAVNKGGKNMQPLELIQMFFESGVLVGRSTNVDGSPAYVNSQPIIPISNSAAQELAQFYQELIGIIQRIESATGYNAPTSGEANPKMLVPGYELANQATNDALYPLAFAEKWLCEQLASDVLLRMQQGVRKGEVSGYAPYGNALNKNVLTFIKLSQNIALRDYGIMLEEQSTEQEKIWLMQQVQQDIANGLLSTSDAILIINTHNAKQAMSILSYRVKKAKEQAQQYELQKLQAQAEGNAQVAQASEQAKLQGRQMEIEMELQKKSMEVMGELKKEEMRIQAEKEIKMFELQMQMGMNTQNNETKKEIAHMDNQTAITTTVIAGEDAKEKQEISNKKPQAKPSSKK